MASTHRYLDGLVSAPAATLRYTFQAGHEGSIPFARSNPKSQFSRLDPHRGGYPRESAHLPVAPSACH
jgi:hypothetical protein